MSAPAPRTAQAASAKPALIAPAASSQPKPKGQKSSDSCSPRKVIISKPKPMDMTADQRTPGPENLISHGAGGSGGGSPCPAAWRMPWWVALTINS